MRVLVELRRADVGTTLSIAVMGGHIDASTFLANMGADAKQCLQKLESDPNAEGIRNMVNRLWDTVGLVNIAGGESNDKENENTKYAMFSLTKLMSSVLPEENSDNNDTDKVVDENSLQN